MTYNLFNLDYNLLLIPLISGHILVLSVDFFKQFYNEKLELFGFFLELDIKNHYLFALEFNPV